jgi:hypothetical protein
MFRPKYHSSMQQEYGVTSQQFAAMFSSANRAAPDYVDPFTGECNATLLAEWVAYDIQQLEWLYVDSHPLFDICAYVAEQNDERGANPV